MRVSQDLSDGTAERGSSFPGNINASMKQFPHFTHIYLPLTWQHAVTAPGGNVLTSVQSRHTQGSAGAIHVRITLMSTCLYSDPHGCLQHRSSILCLFRTIHITQLEPVVASSRTVIQRLVVGRYATKENQWLSVFAWDIVAHVPLSTYISVSHHWHRFTDEGTHRLRLR
jgi:hypothetical protein